MARGGKREGAGRPAGAATKKTREIAEAAMAEGLTPLDYMLSVLRDTTQEQDKRMWAAEKAAPFIHPRLTSVAVDHSSTDGTMTPIVGFQLEVMDEAEVHGNEAAEGLPN